MDLTAWLANLRLERYERVFRENDIDADLLLELTAEDLISLRISSVGHRRKLLAAIATLRVSAQKSSSPSMAATSDVISSPNATISHAERRQLSVMFCDLVGSTALSTKLDPEDMREVLRAYQNAVVESIACLDGHVAKFLGDGVLAYFGWPTAHEDEAGRAVRSALAAIRAVANLRAPDGDALAARIGIATGLVVVGDLLGEGSAREEAIVGETPNLAARLQAIAGSGEIVIAESTRRLVGNAFKLGQLGPQELKGFAGPVTAYSVRAETSAERRLEAFKGVGSTRLIGREQEFDLLLQAWESARAGHGRTLLVRGEPGIGKSHIARALIDRAITDGAVVMRFFCSPYHTSTALFPVIEQLRFAAGLDAKSIQRMQLAKLEALLGRAVKMPQKVLPLFATLLGIAEEGPSSASTLTPGALKSRTLDALINQITGLAHQSPVMMLFEDLHWLDPTTAEFLTMVISSVPRLPLLMLGTARPEFQPTWLAESAVNVVELSRLDRRQSVALIERVIESKFLPEALKAEILAKTEGIPLFIEELTKAVVETVGITEVGKRYELRPLSAFAVPETLYDSLMARLDRLGSPKAVAQIAAVIGREFPYSILALIVDLPQADLAAALTVLEQSTLLQRRGHPPQAVYAFKHALVRDAVYESLLRSRRQILHRRIVDAIEADIPHLAASQPELIAHHCAGAGLTEKAIAYGLKAGAQAVRRAANLEAIEHFRRVLSLNSEQPDTPNRARTELAILSQLGPALMSVHGWPASEVGDVYKRADDIARRLKSSIELTPPLAGLWLFHISRGQFAKAEKISAELFRIAHELDDPNVLLQAHHAAWPTQFLSARLANADQHIHAGMELYDEKRHEQHRYTYLGHDPAVCALSIGTIVRWLLGYPDQAARLEQQAVSMARRLQHAPSLAHGLWFIGDSQLARGDFAAVIATATELLELCEANRLPQPRATALMFLGWGLARSGETTEGTRRLEEGLHLWEKLGARLYLPRSLCLLAEAHLLAGRHTDGLEQIARALQIATQTGEHWYLAQMHHLRAELLLKAHGSDWKAAEACLKTALSIARAQGAKAWELRAGMLSARLLAERGERRKAYEFLHPIYASFTEGHQTADLERAGTLLNALH